MSLLVQLLFEFPTGSTKNVERLSGQNGRLYRYLASGKTIHCFHPAMQELRIGYLNSRISDLRNKYQVDIDDRTIVVPDTFGELTDVKEYSIKPL